MLCGAFQSLGQRKCGTTQYMQRLRNENLIIENEIQFERWVEEKLKSKTRQEVRAQFASYKIQVVVHVIHNGEALGIETNIPDAQIISQVEVLNKDFNRLNADSGNTPAEFQSVAGKMNIEFVLAQQGPDGSPSTGINRVKGTKTSWTISDNDELKSLSYWPSENYLNIWVCNLTDYYGWTQLPVSTLPGLENSSKNRLTDGIIVRYDTFGSIDDGSFNLDPSYNKGRTTTHEVGHFFGLRHIWGDVEGCGGTDYVDDTPPQNGNTAGCPSHPQKECPADNPVVKMFQNYLDYTDDQCMNFFTQGQANIILVTVATFQKIFSPNGDGINDFWKWTNTLDYMGCKLTIFNRFGRKVYEIISYDNSWDGRSSDGQPLEAEAYYYVIHCDGKNEITGGVRIVR